MALSETVLYPLEMSENKMFFMKGFILNEIFSYGNDWISQNMISVNDVDFKRYICCLKLLLLQAKSWLGFPWPKTLSSLKSVFTK